MANSLITPAVIAKEAMMQLENNLVMANNVHREYKQEFVRVGDTVSIRRPVKFTVTDGATLTKQDVEEAKDTIQISQRKHVGWGFTSKDLTLTVEDYSERYIKPAVIVLANQVDTDLCSLYNDVWNWVGTPDQTVNSFSDLSKAPQRLDEMAVPTDRRKGVLASADTWAMASAQTALYMQDRAKEAYTKGALGEIANLELFQDQNVQAHTTGTFTTGSTPLVNGASQNTTYASSGDTNTQSLITDGWAVSTLVLKDGDVFTLAGVNAVNPISKVDTGYLQQFASVGGGTSDGLGNLTQTIAPAIITSGPFQTVTAAPANNAMITPLGAEATNFSQNLVFHRNAFALVTYPLEKPDGVAFAAQETEKGLSIRVVKDYDIINDEDVIRLDILYGVKAIYPDLATRVSGSA